MVTAKIVKDKDGKVVEGVDYKGAISTDKNGNETYYLLKLVSSPGGGVRFGGLIEVKPEVKKPKKKEEEKKN